MPFFLNWSLGIEVVQLSESNIGQAKCKHQPFRDEHLSYVGHDYLTILTTDRLSCVDRWMITSTRFERLLVHRPEAGAKHPVPWGRLASLTVRGR